MLFDPVLVLEVDGTSSLVVEADDPDGLSSCSRPCEDAVGVRLPRDSPLEVAAGTVPSGALPLLFGVNSFSARKEPYRELTCTALWVDQFPTNTTSWVWPGVGDPAEQGREERMHLMVSAMVLKIKKKEKF